MTERNAQNPDGPEAETTASAESPIANVALVRSLLLATARAGEPISYSRLLLALGLRFTRPKMRALCRTLDAIDRDGAAAGEPGLAVLVVRESDGLPGQGWWTDHARTTDYAGPWEGSTAAREIRHRQAEAFAYWNKR